MNNLGECDATPHEELIRQILDSRIPKNEREWAAGREIERLRGLVDEYAAKYGATLNDWMQLRDLLREARDDIDAWQGTWASRETRNPESDALVARIDAALGNVKVTATDQPAARCPDCEHMERYLEQFILVPKETPDQPNGATP